MNIFSIALAFFITANPIGSAPAILSLIKDLPFERQRFILIREALLALVLAFFFQFLGEAFFKAIGISSYAVSFCGGILLFIVSLKLIFPSPSDHPTMKPVHEEPLMVPIATPLISGPGLLTMIMLYSQQNSFTTISLALLITWVGVTGVLAAAPYIQKTLGKRGMLALEQLMGMTLSMIAFELFTTGIQLYLKTLNQEVM